MGTVRYYSVKAQINGGVSVTPSPLGMRYNDIDAQRLDVEVVYMTPDGKQRIFDLTDTKVIFETITPAGALISLSSESSENITITEPAKGRFSFVFPSECKDCVGTASIAYFRFIAKDSNIYSTGDFTYTVVRDVYSIPTKGTPAVKNFNADLKKLQDSFIAVESQAQSAVEKAGKALDEVDTHKQSALPHVFMGSDDKIYRYGLSVADNGCVRFSYEKAVDKVEQY